MNAFILLAGALALAVSPFAAMGELFGYPRSGLAVGLAIGTLYLFALLLVNFGGVHV